MNKHGFGFHSLSAQMILSFIALVLLTAVTAGAPAIWLLRDQLERQAWAQVEQGRRATQALYAAWQSDVADLATLTAQRPTLRDLLARADLYTSHRVEKESLSLRERMALVLSKLQDAGFVPFVHLFELHEGRAGVVVSFLAVLELIKSATIELVQAEAFAPIHVRLSTGN